MGSCAVLITHIHSYDRQRSLSRAPSQKNSLRESAIFDFILYCIPTA